MFNVNLPMILLTLGACCLYVYSMSALGRWLAACRKHSSVAYVAPAPQRTIRA